MLIEKIVRMLLHRKHPDRNSNTIDSKTETQNVLTARRHLTRLLSGEVPPPSAPPKGK